MVASAIKKQSIRFPNGNEAVALFTASNAPVEDLVEELGLDAYKAIILVMGGANSVDAKIAPRLAQLFGRGIARAAERVGAVILDGGTKAGVMAMMGEGVAGGGHKSALIGIAPAGKVALPGSAQKGFPLEPNHTRFVLVEGEGWGSETPVMFRLASLLADNSATRGKRTRPRENGSGKAGGKAPIVAVLAGGGPVSRDEVLRAVRARLPIIVVEGSGGLADQISAAWKEKTKPTAAADAKPEPIDDPVMAEIIGDGEILLHPLSSPIQNIERLIRREFGVDKVLQQAWEVFADYDKNAIVLKTKFHRLQFAILLLGLVATAAAIIQQVYAPKDAQGGLAEVSFREQPVWWLMRYGLILLPIVITVLITAANRFKQGNKWLLLRAGAEAIKREIYRYRTRAQNYKTNPEEQLAARVEDITRRTMRTEVNSSALVRYDRKMGYPPKNAAAREDDGFSRLTPDAYVELRLSDQLGYFQNNCVKYEKRIRRLFWLTFIIGGLGTFLAAINLQVWIALTTAAVAAIGTYLGYMQLENLLMKYNQAATNLSNCKAWWNALSPDEQSKQENIDSLVEHTEQVLQSELDGWVQQMQNALADLRKGQEPAPERNENKEPQEPAPKTKTKTGDAKPDASATEQSSASISAGSDAQTEASAGQSVGGTAPAATDSSSTDSSSSPADSSTAEATSLPMDDESDEGDDAEGGAASDASEAGNANDDSNESDADGSATADSSTPASSSAVESSRGET